MACASGPLAGLRRTPSNLRPSRVGLGESARPRPARNFGPGASGPGAARLVPDATEDDQRGPPYPRSGGMRVELLYFEGCPGAEALLPRLRQLIADADLPAQVLLMRAVESFEEADRLQFLGSPTVRVDGEDVESGALDRRDYGMKCRLYRLDGVQRRVPPEELIREAMRRSLDGGGQDDRSTAPQSA